MKRSIFAAVMALSLAILACSLGNPGQKAPIPMEQLQTAFEKLPSGDVANGQQVFQGQPCKTCHVDLEVGPLFPGTPPLATRAETRKPGYSAELYLYESIVEPNAYVVPGFQSDIMPDDSDQTLTEQELADLLAYLLTIE